MRTKGLDEFRMPRWEELPSIPQYLDQVLALLDEWLGEYLSQDDKPVMTRTMVNNYVKLKFLAAPVNRKYDRLAIASLFVIAVLKPVYTIEEIAYLIKLAIRHNGGDVSYNQFCEYLEDAVMCAFHNTTMKKEKNRKDPRYVLWNACNAFACQLYVRKTYLDEVIAVRERIKERADRRAAEENDTADIVEE
ncbi:MAG: DUF1836 domain-containing protein [Firmicutes bacterium]|nr:DUF1836 domain-containing protein [Bacillota bacterium]